MARIHEIFPEKVPRDVSTIGHRQCAGICSLWDYNKPTTMFWVQGHLSKICRGAGLSAEK